MKGKPYVVVIILLFVLFVSGVLLAGYMGDASRKTYKAFADTNQIERPFTVYVKDAPNGPNQIALLNPQKDRNGEVVSITIALRAVDQEIQMVLPADKVLIEGSKNNLQYALFEGCPRSDYWWIDDSKDFGYNMLRFFGQCSRLYIQLTPDEHAKWDKIVG